MWLFQSSSFILFLNLFPVHFPSLDAVSAKCSSKNEVFPPCAVSLNSRIGLLEPAYSSSETSNLAVGSSQAGPELMYSFKVCWESRCKHNFVSNRTCSPRIQGLLRALNIFLFESPLIKGWTRFDLGAYFFLASSQCHTMVSFHVTSLIQ